MKNRQIWPPYQQCLLLGLIVSLSLIVLAGPLQAEAQGMPSAGPTLIREHEPARELACRYELNAGHPPCRLQLWRPLMTRIPRFELNVARWGLPVYLEWDAHQQWQRISILCFHLSRRRP